MISKSFRPKLQLIFVIVCTTSLVLLAAMYIRTNNSFQFVALPSGMFELNSMLWFLIEKLSQTANSSGRYPDTVVVGVKKCGTGFLHKLLSTNPSIAIAKREVHFFDHHLHQVK